MNRLKKTTNIFYKCLYNLIWQPSMDCEAFCCSRCSANTAALAEKLQLLAIVLLLSTILLQGSRQVLLATPLLLLVSTMLLMFSTLLILVCLPVMHTAVPG
jgi:hypothetical protein